jgi:hypothetical protein
MSALEQTIIVFLLLQILFGFILFQQQKDFFFVLEELFKPKYLIPSLVISGVFLIVNIVLRVLLNLFS